MRVRMKVAMAGPSVERKPGVEYDLPDSEAVRLFAAGYAEQVLPGAAPGQSYPGWTLGIAPDEYLRRFPNGPNAPLARKLLTQHPPVEVR